MKNGLFGSAVSLSNWVEYRGLIYFFYSSTVEWTSNVCVHLAFHLSKLTLCPTTSKKSSWLNSCIFIIPKTKPTHKASTPVSGLLCMGNWKWSLWRTSSWLVLEVRVLKDQEKWGDLIYESGCGRIRSSGDMRFIKTSLVHPTLVFSCYHCRK